MGRNSAEYQIDAISYRGTTLETYAGITFLYILQGMVSIRNYGFSGWLKEDELLLINRNSEYQIEVNGDNVVVKLQLSNHFFTRYYQDYFHYKYIVDAENYPEFKRKALRKVKWLIARVMMVKLQAQSEMQLEHQLLLTDIMLTLVSYFQEESTTDYRSVAKHSSRIEKILNYIDGNYQTALTLQKIAEKERLSLSYLSRLFKQEVGEGFAHYLNKVRFEHAVYDLMNSLKPIYQIIDEHGFTDNKTFLQLFKAHYHTTPGEFRRKNRPASSQKLMKNLEGVHTALLDATASTEKLLPLLMVAINNYANQYDLHKEFGQIKSQNISLTQERVHEALPACNYVIFIGDILELLKENTRQQLLLLKAHVAVHFVEVSHLISGGIIAPEIITDEDFPTYSPYHNSDIALSFLKDHQIGLAVRMNHQRVGQDITSYSEKTRRFIVHSIHLYGYDYVKTWRFTYYDESIVNENSYEFFTTFNRIRAVIHSLVPEIRIGIASPIIDQLDEKSIQNHLDDILNANFIGIQASFHDHFDVTTLDPNFLADEMSFLENRVKSLQHQLKGYGIEVPLYLMRWNTLTGNTRRTNGSYFRGALIFHTLIKIDALVNAIGITLNTETQQETTTNYVIDVKGIALFYVALMPRPIFFVLKFLHQLKGEIIAKGKNYLVTEHAHGYQIALTNVAMFNPYLSVEENLIHGFRKKKIVSFTGIKSGRYQIKRYLLDQQNGALYHEYERFKTRLGYDQEMIGELQKTSPKLTVYDEEIDHLGFTVLADFDVNAIYFYDLKRTY